MTSHAVTAGVDAPMPIKLHVHNHAVTIEQASIAPYDPHSPKPTPTPIPNLRRRPRPTDEPVTEEFDYDYYNGLLIEAEKDDAEANAYNAAMADPASPTSVTTPPPPPPASPSVVIDRHAQPPSAETQANSLYIVLCVLLFITAIVAAVLNHPRTRPTAQAVGQRIKVTLRMG